MKLPATTLCLRWCIMMIAVAVAVLPSFAVAVGYTTVTFERKDDVAGYSSFMTKFRNAVATPTTISCGLRSTLKTPAKGAEYIYAELKMNSTQSVTLGIDVKDLYVWGYQDNISKNRANFFNNTPTAARNSLFPGLTRRFTRFNGTYDALERASGVYRRNLGMGIPSLQTATKEVYGKSEAQLNQGTAEAKFFLVAIQMVAEAARFKFMEEAIVNYDQSQATRYKMVAFQNDWDDISSAIHIAEGEKPKCTKITPTLVIGNVDYKQEVNSVNEIEDEMGIIKYK